jgi:hypothetical protein
VGDGDPVGPVGPVDDTGLWDPYDDSVRWSPSSPPEIWTPDTTGSIVDWNVDFGEDDIPVGYGWGTPVDDPSTLEEWLGFRYVDPSSEPAGPQLEPEPAQPEDRLGTGYQEPIVIRHPRPITGQTIQNIGGKPSLGGEQPFSPYKPSKASTILDASKNIATDVLGGIESMSDAIAGKTQYDQYPRPEKEKEVGRLLGKLNDLVHGWSDETFLWWEQQGVPSSLGDRTPFGPDYAENLKNVVNIIKNEEGIKTQEYGKVHVLAMLNLAKMIGTYGPVGALPSGVVTLSRDIMSGLKNAFADHPEFRGNPVQDVIHGTTWVLGQTLEKTYNATLGKLIDKIDGEKIKEKLSKLNIIEGMKAPAAKTGVKITYTPPKTTRLSPRGGEPQMPVPDYPPPGRINPRQHDRGQERGREGLDPEFYSDDEFVPPPPVDQTTSPAIVQGPQPQERQGQTETFGGKSPEQQRTEKIEAKTITGGPIGKPVGQIETDQLTQEELDKPVQPITPEEIAELADEIMGEIPKGKKFDPNRVDPDRVDPDAVRPKTERRFTPEEQQEFNRQQKQRSEQDKEQRDKAFEDAEPPPELDVPIITKTINITQDDWDNTWPTGIPVSDPLPDDEGGSLWNAPDPSKSSRPFDAVTGEKPELRLEQEWLGGGLAPGEGHRLPEPDAETPPKPKDDVVEEDDVEPKYDEIEYEEPPELPMPHIYPEYRSAGGKYDFIPDPPEPGVGGYYLTEDRVEARLGRTGEDLSGNPLSYGTGTGGNLVKWAGPKGQDWDKPSEEDLTEVEAEVSFKKGEISAETLLKIQQQVELERRQGYFKENQKFENDTTNEAFSKGSAINWLEHGTADYTSLLDTNQTGDFAKETALLNDIERLNYHYGDLMWKVKNSSEYRSGEWGTEQTTSQRIAQNEAIRDVQRRWDGAVGAKQDQIANIDLGNMMGDGEKETAATPSAITLYLSNPNLSPEEAVEQAMQYAGNAQTDLLDQDDSQMWADVNAFNQQLASDMFSQVSSLAREVRGVEFASSSASTANSQEGFKQRQETEKARQAAFNKKQAEFEAKSQAITNELKAYFKKLSETEPLLGASGEAAVARLDVPAKIAYNGTDGGIVQIKDKDGKVVGLGYVGPEAKKKVDEELDGWVSESEFEAYRISLGGQPVTGGGVLMEGEGGQPIWSPKPDEPGP